MARAKKHKAKLTLRQKKFAKLYAATGNASASARGAGYSKKAPGVVGHETLNNPYVRKAIHAALEESLAKAQLKPDHVIEQLRRIAFPDIAELYRPNGSAKHPLEMSEEAKACVQSIETEEITLGGGFKLGDKIKLKTADKTKALELLGKYFKLFAEIHENKNVNVNVDNVDPDKAKEVLNKIKNDC